MSYLNDQNTTMTMDPQKIAEALQAMGYPHVDQVRNLHPGQTLRMPTRGKSSANTAVAVSMFSDGQGAYYHDFATGEAAPIWPDSSRTLTKEESARLSEQAITRKLHADIQRNREQTQVTQIARNMWGAGMNSGTHDYLNNKQLSGIHNARIDAQTGALLVPMWQPAVGIVNLQRIFPDGTKRFLKGGRVTGTYSLIGPLNSAEQVLICEGWATACTLFELHRLPVIVAFNAGNLLSVCRTVRSQFPDIEIIVAGDDDRQTIGNPGKTKALQAAELVEGKLAFPILCKACNCTDHNDAMVCARRCNRG